MPCWHSALLAVATKKRPMVFHFQGNEFVELKDISLADIHCMQWLGDSIFVGMKREWAAPLLSLNVGMLLRGVTS